MPAAGILGWKRSKYQRPILHSSKSPETSRKTFSEYIKNTQRKRFTRGATPYPRGWGAPPTSWASWWPSGGHLLLYGVFWPGKNHKEAFGTKRRHLEAEPGRNQSRALAELFCRGNFPPGGGNHHHHHHQRSSHREGVNLINIFTSTISSQTLVHLLYLIFVSKPQIGTCGLLVVLITPCS